VKLTDRTMEGGAIRISMTGRRAVKLTQSPIPQHSFVQAVIVTEADFANCFGAAGASTDHSRESLFVATVESTDRSFERREVKSD
jgi:hypothetical protein